MILDFKKYKLYRIGLVFTRKAWKESINLPKKAWFCKIACSSKLFTPTCKHFYTDISPISLTFCNSVHFVVILSKCFTPTSFNFLWKIWVITNSKSVGNITWWIYWMRNRDLLLQIFAPFYPCPLLTNSGLSHSLNHFRFWH